MDNPSDHAPTTPQPQAPPARPRRWKRYARWTALSIVTVTLCITFLIKDHVRTLWSLRRVPGTNAYVMDYYVDYHIGEIRSHGMDVDHIEDGLIHVLFPDAIASVAVG